MNIKQFVFALLNPVIRRMRGSHMEIACTLEHMSVVNQASPFNTIIFLKEITKQNFIFTYFLNSIDLSFSKVCFEVY